MAFVYLDADALPVVTDDGPHSSMGLVISRENLAQIKAGRPTLTGTLAVAGESKRWCAVWPTICHIEWIRVPEPTQSATVRLRIDEVDWSVGMAGPAGDDPDFAVAIYVTSATDNTIDLPPSNQDDWAPGAGEQLGLTAVAQTLDLTVNLRGRSGWVAVLVWIWSTLDEVEETSGTLDAHRASGGLTVTWTAGNPASATNPFERALVPESSETAQVLRDLGEVKQVGYYSGHTDREIYTVPPLLTSDSSLSGDPFDLFGMGVLVVTGVAVELIPEALGRPVVDLFYSSEPIEQGGHYGMAAETLRLGRKLVTHHGSGVPYDHVSNMPWFIRSSFGGYPAEVDATYRAIEAFPAFGAVPPSADRNGLRCKLTLAAVRSRRSSATAGTFNIRLAAYDAAGAGGLIVAGPDGPDIELNLQNRFNVSQPWSPLSQSIWGAVFGTTWQFRGCLLSVHLPNLSRDGHDWFRVSHHEILMPETSITYPCIIRVEIKRTSPTPSIDIAAVAATLVLSELDVT